MEVSTRRKRVVIAKWFLIIALLPLATVIVGSVPAIVAATGALVPEWLMEKAMLVTMFFVPLAAIFVLMPIVKDQGRSVLWWGLGIVLLPLGVYILGSILVYLSSRPVPEGA